MTLPGNGRWFQLGKYKNLTIELFNSKTNIKLQYEIIDPVIKTDFQINRTKLLGKGKEVKIDYFPVKEKFEPLNKSITLDNLNVRSGSDFFEKYSSSVVLIKLGGKFGAGFIVGNNSIITNWHVIRGYKSVGVIFKSRGHNKVSFKKSYIADVKYIDPSKDIALLKLRINMPIYPLKILASTESNPNFKVGDEVQTIGHPMGHPWLMAKGYISSELSSDYEWEYEGARFKANVIHTQTPVLIPSESQSQDPMELHTNHSQLIQ